MDLTVNDTVADLSYAAWPASLPLPLTDLSLTLGGGGSSRSSLSPRAAPVTFGAGSGVLNAAGMYVRPLGDTAAPHRRSSGGRNSGGGAGCRFVPDRAAVARAQAHDLKQQHARQPSPVGRENQISAQDVQRQQLQQLALAQQQHAATSAVASAEARVALLASSMLELQRSGGGSFGGAAAISPRAQHTRAASAVASAMALAHNPAHHILVHNEHMQQHHHSPRGRSAGSSPIQMQLSLPRSPAVAPAPMAGASPDEPATSALRPATRSRSFGPVEQQLQLQQRAAAIPGVATPLAPPSAGLWSAGTTASPMPVPFASASLSAATTAAAAVVGTPIAGAASSAPTRLQFTPHIARAVSRAEKQVKQLQQQQQQQHPLQHGSISTRPHLR